MNRLLLNRNFLEPSIPRPKPSNFPSNHNENTQTNQNLIDPETDQNYAKPNPKFTQQLADPTPQKANNTFLHFLAGRPLAEYLREFPLQLRRRRRGGSCGVIAVHFSRGESNDRDFTKSYEIKSPTSWGNRAESQLKSRPKIHGNACGFLIQHHSIFSLLLSLPIFREDEGQNRNFKW